MNYSRIKQQFIHFGKSNRLKLGKPFLKILPIIFMIVFPSIVNAAPKSSYNQINFSFTLSGHIILGVGYSYGFGKNNGVQTMLLIIPEKGLPFGLNGGYFYLTDGEKWRGKLGAEFTLLFSPPDPDRRKCLPMFNFVPGVQYSFDKNNTIMPQLWISYLPTGNKKIVPTGLELRYGRKL